MSEKWSHAESKLLKDSLAAFRACQNETRGPERTKIVNKVLQDILALYDDPSPKLQNDLKHRVKAWYNTYGRTRTSREVFRLRPKYSERDVHMHNHRDEINNALNARKLVKGSGAYLAAFQNQLTEVIRGLPDEEQRAADAEAKKWSKRAPPREVQARNARTKSKKYIGGFAQQIWQQSGMYAVVVTHHKDEKGEIQYLVHDHGAEVCGLSMDDSSPDWQNKPIIDGLVDHATKMYAEATGEQSLRKNKGKAIKIVLKHDNRGFPVLPLLDSVQDLPSKKALIRAYVHAAYCFAAGRVVKHAPWSAIAEHQAELIDPEYLNPISGEVTSDGWHGQDDDSFVVLRDPLKMRDAQITKLVNHWYSREADPDCLWTFRFKAYAGKTEIFEALNKPVVLADKEDSPEEEIEDPDETPPSRPQSKQKKSKGKADPKPTKGKGKNRKSEGRSESPVNADDSSGGEGHAEGDGKRVESKGKTGPRPTKGKGKNRKSEERSESPVNADDSSGGEEHAEGDGMRVDFTGKDRQKKADVFEDEDRGSGSGYEEDIQDVVSERGIGKGKGRETEPPTAVLQTTDPFLPENDSRSALASGPVDQDQPSRGRSNPAQPNDNGEEDVDSQVPRDIDTQDIGNGFRVGEDISKVPEISFQQSRFSQSAGTERPNPFASGRRHGILSRSKPLIQSPEPDSDAEDVQPTGLPGAPTPIQGPPRPQSQSSSSRRMDTTEFSTGQGNSISSAFRTTRNDDDFGEDDVRDYWEGLDRGISGIVSLKEEGVANYEPTPSPEKAKRRVSFSTDVEVKRIPGPLHTRAHTKAIAAAEQAAATLANPPAMMTRKKTRDLANTEDGGLAAGQPTRNAPVPSKKTTPKGKPKPKPRPQGRPLQTDQEEMDARSARTKELAKARAGRASRRH